MQIFGIDIGSSYIKTSILNLERGTVEETQILPTPDFKDKRGYLREIPINDLMLAVKGMIDNAILTRGVEGIIISTQMHGYILLDGSGSPAGDYVSWQDMRGLDFPGDGGAVAAISSRIPPDILAQNGVVLKNTLSLTPLYCARQRGEIPGKASFAMLGDALIRMLTGEPAPIHPTIAASSGLYSLTTGDWNRELIELLDLGILNFPQIHTGNEPAAFYRSGTGKQVPIYAAVGDHQAAIFGVDAEDGSIVINIGTGGQICYIGKNLCFGGYETRPYFNGGNLRVFAQLPSGRALNLLMDFASGIGAQLFDANENCGDTAALWDRINKLAAQAESESAANEFAPLSVGMNFFNAADSDGGYIRGITTGNLNIGSLFFGAYASMADEYRAAYEKLFAEREKKAEKVICTGGVMQKTPLLMKMIGERFDIPCALACGTEDLMNGLMRLADRYI